LYFLIFIFLIDFWCQYTSFIGFLVIFLYLYTYFYCCCTFCLLICHVIVIYVIPFEVNFIDFSFVDCISVYLWMWLLVIYFHNYFLMVFCHFGGLFFFYIFNVLYCFLYLVVVFAVFRRVFLVGTCCSFLINIYYILYYLCLYSVLLCSKWATVNFHLRQNQKKGKCETDKLSWSEYWLNWWSITLFGVDLGDA
jgi:hypothetical protein